MRFVEFNLDESMSFHSYKKDPEKGYFRMVTGDQERYQDEVYKTNFAGDPKDYINPNYDPEHDLNLSNANAAEVFDVLG